MKIKISIFTTHLLYSDVSEWLVRLADIVKKAVKHGRYSQ